MHISFEIIKELLGIWEGTYKASMVTGVVDGKLEGDYVVSRSDWDAIDQEVSQSNATVPAQMARRLGSVSRRGYWTAETYSYFLCSLGPIVSKDRLAKVYYDHFVRLSQCTKMMTKLEITVEELETLTQGLVDWDKDFERYVMLRC
jgi:hypothetical protein